MPDTITRPPRTPVSGPMLFARYAFPPNSHGFCGPADHGAFFEHAVTGNDERGLRDLSRQFAGAWPYLELIAASLGINDPLDRRVVDAYWVGNSRLNQVTATAVGKSMEDRFRPMLGSAFSTLAESVNAGGVPHHSFAVFCIYPWTGLLSDNRKAEHAINVLDQCRIRWGKVLAVQGDQVVVESTPLTWDGHTLAFGERHTETVVRSLDGTSMMDDLMVGDWVAMHWEWVCDVLSLRQVRYLRDFTVRHLRIVNEGNLHKGPSALLGT
ncbi:MAG: DUF6390 family protein [Aeromicrobium sp.]